jgi:hypothetical protein
VWKTQRHNIKIAINEWLTGAWCQVLQDHHPEANKQPAIKPKKITRKRGQPTYIDIFEGSLEVKLPTIWTVEKQR